MVAASIRIATPPIPLAPRQGGEGRGEGVSIIERDASQEAPLDRNRGHRPRPEIATASPQPSPPFGGRGR
jgi:hypothetical protein